MHALKEHRSPTKALPDLLNWAAVIDDGIVLNKDGSLMAGFFYRGQDLATVTAAERNRVSAVVNAALSKLGSEWMLHQDAVRVEARAYPAPEESAFPDPITALIDQERRYQFGRADAHYESIYAMVVTYLPAKLTQSKVADMMFEETGNANKKGRSGAGDRALRQFKSALLEIEDRLSSVLDLNRMQGIPYLDEDGREHINDQLLQFLHYSLTGNPHPINLPPCPMYLDAVIGGHEFWSGIVPRLDDKLIQVVAIDGFPQESYPGILAALDQVPVQYRWNTRFIFQDPVDAQAGLRAYRRKWQQKVRGFWDQVFHSQQTAKGSVDQDAAQMVAEAESALAEASSGLVTYGYYTSVVVLMDDDRERLEQSARQIKRLVNNLGFNARVETVNTVEAWLGSLPGHSAPNMRRPMLHTLHLADMLPLSSVWAGRDRAPCPFYPNGSPALLHAATDGSTPFRLNLHIGDLGHTLMLGPTGSGKSTALALIAAQFRRYKGATVFAFDKGNSMEPLTRAIGGQHYNVAGDSDESELCFAPLASIDQPGELGWAEDWVATLIELQGLKLKPTQRNELHRALVAVQEKGERTLTNLQIELQDKDMKDALEEYTLSGALGQLLDSEEDGLAVGTWSVFEIEQLMHRSDRVRLPVLLYLFHVIERRMKGQPCLLILDEAWLMLGNEVFRAKIREWLKVLRKANCAVLLATQSLSDAANSGILDVLAESCPTKIFLANKEASSEENIQLYKLLGCNEAEIRTITDMTSKREYFVRGEGRRRIELAIGPVALSFVGASGKEDIARVRELEAEHGEQWPYYWMEERGVNHEYLEA
jgi:type IV secretion system protein VirB4